MADRGANLVVRYSFLVGVLGVQIGNQWVMSVQRVWMVVKGNKTGLLMVVWFVLMVCHRVLQEKVARDDRRSFELQHDASLHHHTYPNAPSPFPPSVLNDLFKENMLAEKLGVVGGGLIIWYEGSSGCDAVPPFLSAVSTTCSLHGYKQFGMFKNKIKGIRDDDLSSNI